MAKLAVVNNVVGIRMATMKGVPKENIFTVEEFDLASTIKTDDSLCVTSIVDVFDSVKAFLSALKVLRSRSCEFISRDERRLNFSVVRPLQSSVYRTIEQFVNTENFTANILMGERSFYSSSESKERALSTVGKNQISLLAHVLDNETHHRFRY